MIKIIIGFVIYVKVKACDSIYSFHCKQCGYDVSAQNALGNIPKIEKRVVALFFNEKFLKID